MNEWHGNIQKIIDITDIGIKNKNDEELTLKRLADELGYSEFYVSRKFREISGMQFRDYLRYRRLAFALTDLRDTDRGILDIALDHGFSSHEAFTRAFREAYGIRLPMDYSGEIPPQMQIMDVPEGEYIVFEHGPFDFETENQQTEAEIEQAMKDFDYRSSGYELDTSQGRVFYFYHDPTRFWKYVRPVRKIK